jgi:hypothetical protein
MTDDPRVSKTYRETATERAPEHLDAAVLRTAAKAARPRYSLLRTWTRPVAWAAVVMLSFALLLELTQTPVTDSGYQELSDAPATIAAPAAELREDRQQREKQEVQEFKVRDADMLQRAEDMARMQQGASGEPAPAAAEPAAVEAFAADSVVAEEAAGQATMPLPEKSALRSRTAPVEMEPACDESARAEPETWLACIVALEESGQTEVAEAERELFKAAFPAFTE